MYFYFNLISYKHAEILISSEILKKEKNPLGVPWWLSGLKIQKSHCCCGMGSILGPIISTCYRNGQKKKKKKKKGKETKENFIFF